MAVRRRRRMPSAMFGKEMTFDSGDSPLVSPPLLLYNSDYGNTKTLRITSFSKSESDSDQSAFEPVLNNLQYSVLFEHFEKQA